MTSKNKFENDPNFKYLRFPVGNHYRSNQDMYTDSGIYRFFRPLFKWIEEELKAGNNIMIHCLAGAHRAGCATISWLMYKENLSFEKATILAKEKRDRIDPIGSFPAVLIKLENALNNT